MVVMLFFRSYMASLKYSDIPTRFLLCLWWEFYTLSYCMVSLSPMASLRYLVTIRNDIVSVVKKSVCGKEK